MNKMKSLIIIFVLVISLVFVAIAILPPPPPIPSLNPDGLPWLSNETESINQTQNDSSNQEDLGSIGTRSERGGSTNGNFFEGVAETKKIPENMFNQTNTTLNNSSNQINIVAEDMASEENKEVKTENEMNNEEINRIESPQQIQTDTKILPKILMAIGGILLISILIIIIIITKNKISKKTNLIKQTNNENSLNSTLNTNQYLNKNNTELNQNNNNQFSNQNNHYNQTNNNSFNQSQTNIESKSIIAEPEEQVKEYIQIMRQHGFKDELIKTKLLSVGWNENTINNLLK